MVRALRPWKREVSSMKVAMIPGEGQLPGTLCKVLSSVWQAKAIRVAVRRAGSQTTQARFRWVSGHAGDTLQSEERLGTRLHLHDDGFLGDFSLLLSDYKENSRNSEGYRSASAPG